MDIREFAEEMRTRLLERMEGAISIRIERRLKNNSVEPTALVFTEEKCNVSPMIYVDGYYQQYREGTSLEANAEQMIIAYQNAREHPLVDVSFMYDWEKVKTLVTFKLINTERNLELLQSIPHQEILDLSMVFLITLKEVGGTIMIYNNHCDMWGIELEELVCVAKENTPVINPISVISMKDIARELFVDEADEIPDELEMYILSNQSKSLGAAAMLYPDSVKNIADRLESDLYILPSSIHEVLLVPTKCNDVTYLKHMVRSVNNNDVAIEDILGYNVYLYNREKVEFNIVL